MPRYIAFLRGVSPMNLKMADLKSCLQAAGFDDVKTLLSSGNAVFESTLRSSAAVEKMIEATMQKKLGKIFTPYVRSAQELTELIAANPFSQYTLPKGAKRVVTFLRESPAASPELPIEKGGACIYALVGREIYTAYVPNPEGPVFMKLLGDCFGKTQTTRTWDTVLKCAKS